MTIEEAIQHCKEQAATLRMTGDNGCAECAAEHEQLAEWLEELREKRCNVIVQKNRIEELEADVNEQLAKRADAYNKLWDAYAHIDELIRAREEQE